jgi:hypothetical protein
MDRYIKLNAHGQVELTPTGKAVPELDKLIPDHLIYLFFVYSSSSPYTNYTERDRKKLVVKQKTTQDQETIEKSKDFKAALTRYMDMNVIPSERFARGAIKKMEELLDYWNKLKVTAGNYKEVADSIKGSTGILEMYKQFKAMFEQEEKKIRTRGEADIAMFETMENLQTYLNE